MMLTPRETEKLWIFVLADVARRRRARGTKLNYAEATALIAEAVLEGARDGRRVAELMDVGRTIVAAEDCMDGVAALLPMVQVEATFPDGTKLVTVHDPIVGGDSDSVAEGGHAHSGPYVVAAGEIELNAGRARVRLEVSNTGDRAIQVGSHFHFFEVNRALRFDRRAAFGMRLDIPSGTAARFESGDVREVDLVALGGSRRAVGLNGLVNGSVDAPTADAFATARLRGFMDETGGESGTAAASPEQG